MLNNSLKRNIKSLSTPYRIIKILKLLIENPLSINEILKKLEEDDIFINTETLSKYLSTLKLSGCNIQKIKNKYYVKYPFLSLNEAELETLADFDIICKNLNSKTNYEEFQKFLNKLFSLVKNPKQYDNIYKTQNINDFNTKKISEKYREKIEIISKFLNDGTEKVKILFEGKEYKAAPLKFHYFKDSICLLCYDLKNNVNRYFPLDKISDIKEINSLPALLDFGLITTFKISGRLKNAYFVREEETVSEYKDYIIVSNKKEDKNELFKRLLKYGSCCEVLYPKTDREKFKNLIKELIIKHEAK